MAPFLDAIPTNEDTCFVCGRRAATIEHLIPKWLQHRFNLWDQKLQIPNGTTVAYRQLQIPACARCNNEVFSRLEKQIESGQADDATIWRWMNKIHYGLCYKDKVFDWDRRHPGVKIDDVVNPDDPFERDRHVLHCVSGDFRAEPDPFGSVFTFHFAEEQPFMMAHNAISRSLAISLGPVGYVAFVVDGQALRRDEATTLVYQQQSQRDGGMVHMLFFYAQAIEHLARHELGQNIVMSAGFIARLGKTVVHKVEPPNRERFRRICWSVGIEWGDGDPEGRYRLRDPW